MVRKLNRRTVLRGIGGIGVALPALEAMGQTTSSGSKGGPPSRFMNAYAGVAIGSDGTRQGGDILFVPTTVGAGYDLRPALESLGELGIKDKVSVVSNLLIPWEPGAPGGRPRVTVHNRTWCNQTSGQTTVHVDYHIPSPRNVKLFSSCDQMMRDHIAGDTLHPVLPLKLQANKDFPFSYRVDGSNVQNVPPISSPRLAYESIFAGFTAPSSTTKPIDNSRAIAELRGRRTVLDMVRENTQRLLPRLGAWDRQRMDQHLQSIREIELKLERLEGRPASGGVMCSSPATPGQDPPVDNSLKAAWSGENERSEILSSLIASAFACDLSRVVSYALTEVKCYLPLSKLTNGRISGGECHTYSHGSGPAAQQASAAALSWMLRQWGLVIKKLGDLPEADGSTVLDHTATVIYFEGGHGFNPDGNGTGKSHSSENMGVLIAGGARLGLKQGHHIPGTKRHPAQVVLTAMNAAGFPGNKFGEVEGNIPELFV